MVQQQPNALAGGPLTEMAPTGTSIPKNAGKQNTITSVPRPNQRTQSSYFSHHGPAQSTTGMVVDNATDIPRSTHDRGETGEVMTGTGNLLPGGVESKYMSMSISGRSMDEEYEVEEVRKIGVHQFFGIESSY